MRRNECVWYQGVTKYNDKSVTCYECGRADCGRTPAKALVYPTPSVVVIALINMLGRISG